MHMIVCVRVYTVCMCVGRMVLCMCLCRVMYVCSVCMYVRGYVKACMYIFIHPLFLCGERAES